jgi:hypothetical protein
LKTPFDIVIAEHGLYRLSGEVRQFIDQDGFQQDFAQEAQAGNGARCAPYAAYRGENTVNALLDADAVL